MCSTPSSQDWSISGSVFTKRHPILSSSPNTQISQRPEDTQEVGCWLEFNDTSKPWPETYTIAGQEEQRFEWNTFLLSVSSTLFYPQSIQAGDLNHLVIVFLFRLISIVLPEREGISESSNKCFPQESIIYHSSHTSHFPFGPFSTPLESALFISFSKDVSLRENNGLNQGGTIMSNIASKSLNSKLYLPFPIFQGLSTEITMIPFAWESKLRKQEVNSSRQNNSGS